MGFGVYLGFSNFRVWGFKVRGLGLRVLEFMVWGLRYRVWGVEFGVSELGV